MLSLFHKPIRQMVVTSGNHPLSLYSTIPIRSLDSAHPIFLDIALRIEGYKLSWENWEFIQEVVDGETVGITLRKKNP